MPAPAVGPLENSGTQSAPVRLSPGILKRWVIPVFLALAWIALWGGHSFKSAYLTLATGVQDDTYYYLLPAWNVSRVGWFTFDGVTSSYGFQPLWALCLALFGKFANSRETFLRLALFMCAISYAGTALAAGRAARLIWRSVNHQPGVLALFVTCALLLLNTPVQLSNLTGKENALYGFLFVTLMNLHLDDRVTGRRWFPFVSGAIAGLILLARLSPMSLAVVAVQPLIARRQQPLVAFIAKYVTATTLTMLPWLLYAKLAFGFALPSSDRLNIDAAWESFANGGPGLWTSAHVTAEYLNACVRFALGLASNFWPASHQYDRAGVVLVPLLVLSGIAWLIARTAPRVGRRSTVVEPAAYTLIVFCVVIAATAVIPIALSGDLEDLYYRRWYIVELPILVAVLGGIGTEVIAALVMPSPPVVRVLLTAGLVLWLAMSGRQTVTIGRPSPSYRDEGQWQQVTLRAAMWSNRELSLTRNDRIGAFSAGLLGWFSNGTVINLDGLANDEVARLLREKRSIDQYCEDRGVRVYVDAVDPSELFRHYNVRAKFRNSSRQFPIYYIADIGPGAPTDWRSRNRAP